MIIDGAYNHEQLDADLKQAIEPKVPVCTKAKLHAANDGHMHFIAALATVDHLPGRIWQVARARPQLHPAVASQPSRAPKSWMPPPRSSRNSNREPVSDMPR